VAKYFRTVLGRLTTDDSVFRAHRILLFLYDYKETAVGGVFKAYLQGELRLPQKNIEKALSYLIDHGLAERVEAPIETFKITQRGIEFVDGRPSSGPFPERKSLEISDETGRKLRARINACISKHELVVLLSEQLWEASAEFEASLARKSKRTKTGFMPGLMDELLSQLQCAEDELSRAMRRLDSFVRSHKELSGQGFEVLDRSCRIN